MKKADEDARNNERGWRRLKGMLGAVREVRTSGKGEGLQIDEDQNLFNR